MTQKSRNEQHIPTIIEAQHALQPDVVAATDLVLLPTKGKYYPPDHPLKDQDHIEVKYMTGRQEDILSNKKLIKQGLAVDKMLESIIVDKRIKLSSIFIGDKNAMIVAARVGGYGSEYTAMVTCPGCGDKTKHPFDLNKIEIKYDVDDLISEEGTFSADLPVLKLSVVCKLLTSADENWITKQQKINKKAKLPESTMTDQLVAFISSIAGETDQNKIKKIVQNMPVSDRYYLRRKYKQTIPNVDMKQDFLCSECDDEREVEVPFTAEFFWPQ